LWGFNNDLLKMRGIGAFQCQHKNYKNCLKFSKIVDQKICKMVVKKVSGCWT
jgi:hypothetical protein